MRVSPGSSVEGGETATDRFGGEIAVRRWDCEVRFFWGGCDSFIGQSQKTGLFVLKLNYVRENPIKLGSESGRAFFSAGFLDSKRSVARV
jgi:hypothetical protein